MPNNESSNWKLLGDADLWLSRLKPRWMDLVGDYAGDEFFIVDGDSLCQKILEDDLVAIGRDEPSFQILHGIYCLEQAILELKKQGCNFDITFFECNKHGTIATGSRPFVSSSRALAREIIKSHLKRLTVDGKVGSAVFEDLDDPEWQRYAKDKRPKFVLCNIGPSLDSVKDNEFYAIARIIIQRKFVQELLISRFAVAALNQMECIDSKILTFVYERQRTGDTTQGVPKHWSRVAGSSMAACDRKIETVLPSRNSSQPCSLKTRQDWLVQAVKNTLAGSKNNLDTSLAFLFLGAQLILPSLSLPQRAQYSCRVDPNLRSHLLSKFIPGIFQHLASLLGNLGNAPFSADLDGNVFLVVLSCTIEVKDPSSEKIFGHNLARSVVTQWSSTKLPVPDLTILARTYSHVSTPVPATPNHRIRFKLLPFSHPIFDKYLPLVGIDGKSAVGSADNPTRIEKLCDAPLGEEKHWHSTKSILPKHSRRRDDHMQASTDWDATGKQQQDDIFVANVHRQAQTLTGAQGQPIERIIIAEAGASPSAPGISSKRNKKRTTSKSQPTTSKPIQGPNSKPSQPYSSQDSNANTTAAEGSENPSEDDIWWKSQLDKMKGIDELQALLNKVNIILEGERAETGWLAIEVRLFRIHLNIQAWISHERSESESVCEGYIVRILWYINELRGHPSLFPAAAEVLTQVLKVLGFDSIAPFTANLQDEREMSFKFVKLTRSKSGKPLYPHLRIKVSPSEFQLKAYGPYMDRSVDSKQDPRVRFHPDGWQRQVLDMIDQKKSILVVAPTSAGKTFSSFYAMEKVLREGDDGVVVYVSPTKALCQQIAADIHARFSKDMKGRNVWAIHTRDVRVNDPLQSQILVTVPEVLSTLLLSPSMARAWVPHLKYIILDEIHSIGQLEGGQTWEHIILLSNCPIIGLSATIGQPEVFSDWLHSVQKEHNQEYSMVQHKDRHAYIRKYIWKLPESQPDRDFKGLQSPPPNDSRLRILHPMCALLLGGSTIPPDLALESHDCLSLYSMMKTCVSSRRLGHLQPEIFFADKQGELLKRLDIIRYGEALKDLVIEWAQAPDSHNPESPYQKLLVAIRADMDCNGSMKSFEGTSPDIVSTDNFIELLHKLSSNNDLPCIAFNFNRAGCERIAKALLHTLEQGERSWRKSNPRWKEKLRQWEAWKLRGGLNVPVAERANHQGGRGQMGLPSATWHSSFDPNDPSPEFSFANTKCGYSREEFQKDTNSSREPSDEPEDHSPWYVQALERGIAVHHAGMPKAYRSLVESLFRLGYCRVMISTGTLALGINAPAKSVIFVGDSPYLTALMYRQCAGRAGRRGMDLLGKVIFYNLPLDRVHRLMLSRIPPLTGHWPLTTTFCLRLFNLLTESNQAPSAVSAVDSLMRLPRLSASSDQTRQEVLHHMRFSIEYLRRLGLLSDSGHTTALFGTVGHLYYEEPGNLAFAALVRKGIVHQICSTFWRDKYETEINVVHLVATLFARRPLPHFATSDEVLKRLRKATPSTIVLPPLPDYILKALERHNKETLQVFENYAASYAQLHLVETPENTLPLSQHQVNYSTEPTGGELQSALEKRSIKGCVVRSRFVSNSGKDDEFRTIRELCQSSRSGLHLNAKSVPSFNYTDPVNAYALDYWRHESVRPLVEANGLSESEVAFMLESFSKILQTLLASIRTILVERVTAETDAHAPEDNQSREDANQDEKMGGKNKKRVHGKKKLHGSVDITSRPPGVPEEDWVVYEAFRSVNNTFRRKLQKIWTDVPSSALNPDL